MMRGDNELLSVMYEMDDTEPPLSKTSNEIQNNQEEEGNSRPESNDKYTSRIRLLPEIKGYGDENATFDKKKNPIWNPYVRIDENHVRNEASATNLSYTLLSPSNPDVEVMRRRAYEKFKEKFKTRFQWISSSGGNGKNTAKEAKNIIMKAHNTRSISDVSQLWLYIPSHNILERFHFAAKVEESFSVMENIKSSTVFDHSNSVDIHRSHDWSIVDIKASWINGKENGSIIDPILICSTKQIELKGSSCKNFKDNFELLKSEIIFQFTREWKKANITLSIEKRESDMELLESYFTTSNFQRKCRKICKEINNLCMETDGEFLSYLTKRATEINSSSASKNNRQRKQKGIPKVSIQEQKNKSADNESIEVMNVTHLGLSFRISIPHYEKLQMLFDRNVTSSITSIEHHNSFYKALFTALCRYDMLEGGGLQSALSGHIFDVLLKRFHCNMECFASPFNCRYESYCSAFPDTDVSFGSMGSFFDFNFEALPNGGCFQANPPFTADFILAMYTRMEKILSNEATHSPYMFIVFIPAWTYSTGWQAISSSKHLTKSLMLLQKDHPHYYCEGTQHRRLAGRYRIASFDTSVFFLQNHIAKERWPVTTEIIEELKLAFASNPEEAFIHANYKKKNGCDIKHTKKDSIVNDKSNDNPKSSVVNRDAGKAKKRRKLKAPKESTHGKKKKFVDDSAKQHDILASLGILDGKKTKKQKSGTKRK